MMKVMKKSQAGFTLAEMMIMLVIFAVIFTLSLVNFRRGERLEAFRLATMAVGDYLRQAQTAALTGTGTVANMSQSYGVYFDLSAAGQYLFFKDDDNNHLYGVGLDEIVETVALPDEITLSALTNNGPVSIVFEPPKPNIYISAGANPYQLAEIRLARQYFPNKEGLVSLNGITGQVSAELVDVP